MFDEAISLISMCSSMNSWLTPTVLFLLLNLMIGTIAFTSAFTSPKPTTHLQPHDQPSFHHHHLHHQQQPSLHLHQQHHQQILQPLLSRSSSVLQRIKSINFSTLYNFSSHPPATHFQPEPEPEPEPEHHQTDPQSAVASAAAEDEDSPSMEEIYSRIKQTSQVPHYGRQNSDTKPSGGEVPVKLPKKMKKSASHKSAFNHFQIQTGNNNNHNRNVGVNREFVETVEEEERESEVKEEREDACVDAKADDFINRFKKQLQLQRDESIVRYKKMISRISAQ